MTRSLSNALCTLKAVRDPACVGRIDRRASAIDFHLEQLGGLTLLVTALQASLEPKVVEFVKAWEGGRG